MKEIDEPYTMAREVLLDALTALGDHRSSIVLVGAQAIYLRVPCVPSRLVINDFF